MLNGFFSIDPNASVPTAPNQSPTPSKCWFYYHCIATYVILKYAIGYIQCIYSCNEHRGILVQLFITSRKELVSLNFTLIWCSQKRIVFFCRASLKTCTHPHNNQFLGSTFVYMSSYYVMYTLYDITQLHWRSLFHM